MSNNCLRMFSKSAHDLDYFKTNVWIGGNMRLECQTHFANWILHVRLQFPNTNKIYVTRSSHGDQSGQLQSRCTKVHTHTNHAQCIAYMHHMLIRALFCAHRTWMHAPFNAHIHFLTCMSAWKQNQIQCEIGFISCSWLVQVQFANWVHKQREVLKCSLMNWLCMTP